MKPLGIIASTSSLWLSMLVSVDYGGSVRLNSLILAIMLMLCIAWYIPAVVLIWKTYCCL
jgi:hypothetical protein